MTVVSTNQDALIRLSKASKFIVEGPNQVYPAFRNLNLDILSGQRLGIFGVNGYESRMLVSCLSGVEQLDSGKLEQNALVSWPLGANQAFETKLSGYQNARFSAEIYGNPIRIREEIKFIQEISWVDEETFHLPLSEWSPVQRDNLKLAVGLAFSFDVIMVGKISTWNHKALHPNSIRIRKAFEALIDGRSLVIAANGQYNFAMDYCTEGIAIVDGYVAYHGDPEVCLELVREESKRQKQRRKERIQNRISQMTQQEGDADRLDEEDEFL